MRCSLAPPGKTRRAVNAHRVSSCLEAALVGLSQFGRRNNPCRHGVYPSFPLEGGLGNTLLGQSAYLASFRRVPLKHAADVVVEDNQLAGVAGGGHCEQRFADLCCLKGCRLSVAVQRHERHRLLAELGHPLAPGAHEVLAAPLAFG